MLHQRVLHTEVPWGLVEHTLSANLHVRDKASDGLLKSVYAAHYVEIEALFLQAGNQTETRQQKAGLELLKDNLILLQATLRDKKMLPADFISPLQRDENQIKELHQKVYHDFELLPARKS